MGGGQPHSTMSTSYPRLAGLPVGKRITKLYEERLRMFTSDGQYASSSLLSKLYEARASGEPSIKLSVYSVPDLSRPTFKDATSQKFKPIKTGESFGPSWSTHWFRVQITLDKDIRDKNHLEFHWDSNSEALVWSEDGVPLQGLTGGGERVEWILPKGYRDGKEHTFYVEMACNGMFGNPKGGDTIQPPQEDRYFKLSRAEVVAVNLEARALKIDFWIIGDAAREFSQESWEQHEALKVCNDIMDCFIAGKGTDKCLAECRRLAQTYLGDKVDSSKVYDSDADVLVHGIGHCHIDSCWLWPWAETKRKVARSWANQCNLLDQYPEHRFCCSQAQQYKWLEEDYPALYDRVRSKVKEGTFQPIGGSWVEHDTNMPSGESLVRQFLYGQRYFESHFGERSTTFWLPDTFGYSAQLPQICRLAGMTRFFTQKLSWNNINSFPHTTFNWVSLDGSQVLCHMAPSETYTAEADFGDVKRSITQHKSMDQDPRSLLVFGKGDGGGGPTWEMLEKLRRCRGMSDKVGLLPRVGMGQTVDEFFAKLEKKIEDGTDFVTWYGELYFELHRGTYTTQANNKKNNRKAEIMLHDIEFMATYASIQDLVTHDLAKGSYKYPKAEIDEMWENVLLCQFHDCLPGSSIEMCYDDSDELYAKVFKTGEKLLTEAARALGFKRPSNSKGDLVAINTLSAPRHEIIQMPNEGHVPEYGILKGEMGLSKIDRLTPASASIASIEEKKKGVFILSNDQYAVEVSSGAITSLYDKTNDREVIPKGSKANQLVIFDDKPLYWQAWDVEVYHLGSREELHATSESTIAEKGPHRVSVVTLTKISELSWVKTTVSLSASLPGAPSYVEIAAEVEWREDKKFLKVEFPVDVRNTDASYETQYGIVRRPTHYNTSWDMAKFEVCCHKWADLSESTYGVSILNDCKYGFATQGNVMRLSLLRAPKAPDAHADMGRHHFRYAIMPHSGPLDARTVKAAFAFNNPVATSHTSASTPLFPFTTSNLSPYIYTSSSSVDAGALLASIRLHPSSSPGLILDTIKRGEDDEDVSRGTLPARKGRSVIVRVYDALGGKCRGRLVFGEMLKVKAVRKCNVLEDDEKEELTMRTSEAAGGSGPSEVDFSVRAFEVLTLRVEL